ncbi:MAG: hypothetical protein WC891_08690 [Actinomycetota bacterium]
MTSKEVIEFVECRVRDYTNPWSRDVVRFIVAAIRERDEALAKLVKLQRLKDNWSDAYQEAETERLDLKYKLEASEQRNREWEKAWGRMADAIGYLYDKKLEPNLTLFYQQLEIVRAGVQKYDPRNKPAPREPFGTEWGGVVLMKHDLGSATRCIERERKASGMRQSMKKMEAEQPLTLAEALAKFGPGMRLESIQGMRAKAKRDRYWWEWPEGAVGPKCCTIDWHSVDGPILGEELVKPCWTVKPLEEL